MSTINSTNRATYFNLNMLRYEALIHEREAKLFKVVSCIVMELFIANTMITFFFILNIKLCMAPFVLSYFYAILLQCRYRKVYKDYYISHISHKVTSMNKLEWINYSKQYI